MTLLTYDNNSLSDIRISTLIFKESSIKKRKKNSMTRYIVFYFSSIDLEEVPPSAAVDPVGPSLPSRLLAWCLSTLEPSSHIYIQTSSKGQSRKTWNTGIAQLSNTSSGWVPTSLLPKAFGAAEETMRLA